MKKVIVFSGINITSGGPLTILRHFFFFAERELQQFEVFFLVKSKGILPTPTIVKIIEYPNSQRTFLHKIYYEYFAFRALSKKLNSFAWLSLNDCTPSVNANVRTVYIHNATPLYKFSFLDFLFPSRILLQKFYYRYLLKLNLNKNDYVVVQQAFMKTYVEGELGFKNGKVLVSPPILDIPRPSDKAQFLKRKEVVFIYPTKPEVYKNLHLLVKAVELLDNSALPSFSVLITISGNENRYGKFIRRMAKSNPCIEFIGPLPHQDLIDVLHASDCLIFPSKLETWGLPLSEAIALNKFILSARLPYAKETIGNYPRASYFNPDSPLELADKIACYLSNCHQEVTNIDDSKVLPDAGARNNNTTNLFNAVLRLTQDDSINNNTDKQ